MATAKSAFSSLGFAKTFVLPGLLVFLVPVISLLFFLHAQRQFDAQAREDVLAQIRADESMTPEQREQATAFFTEHPFSELVLDEEFAADVESTALFYYQSFRWMIWLSVLSIASGVAVFVVAGLCILLSLRSQRVQYLSLSVGWQLLRIYGALQTIAQGVMLVALSFWVTALWFEFYSVKLILIAGLLALGAAAAVIAAIFKRTDYTPSIAGVIVDNSVSMPLWNELRAICDKVGTAPPDHVIVGIDDNFFVTEQPVTVDGKTLEGRKLYLSLSLLKQINGTEADAILAHEMAHFSGEDTVYTRKISPLLLRYGNYLQALYNGGITRPIFYFMNCFRALFELSLGKLSRQREFRADRIAAETTSQRDMAVGLLRVSAYSKFRNEIQQGLFKQERALEAANISQLIGEGFQSFATKFTSKQDLGELETSHPFDSHPPLVQRLSAVGVTLTPQYVDQMLATPGDGRWFWKIHNAEEIERQQWFEFEEGFRKFHEETLAYRFIPETEEQRSIVVKAFPQLTIAGKSATLVLDCDCIECTGWSAPIQYREITKCVVDDSGTLEIQYARDGNHRQKLRLKDFGTRKQEALDSINRYYTRYLHAVACQEQQKLEANSQSEGA